MQDIIDITVIRNEQVYELQVIEGAYTPPGGFFATQNLLSEVSHSLAQQEELQKNIGLGITNFLATYLLAKVAL